MGKHEQYGKRLVQRVVGTNNMRSGTTAPIDLGAGCAIIDCIVGGHQIDLEKRIVVEIESRTSKQVRGALLDLILHECQKKLLILIPAHMNGEKTKTACENILKKFVRDPSDYKVVLTTGTGTSENEIEDSKRIQTALCALGYIPCV